MSPESHAAVGLVGEPGLSKGATQAPNPSKRASGRAVAPVQTRFEACSEREARRASASGNEERVEARLAAWPPCVNRATCARSPARARVKGTSTRELSRVTLDCTCSDARSSPRRAPNRGTWTSAARSPLLALPPQPRSFPAAYCSVGGRADLDQDGVAAVAVSPRVSTGTAPAFAFPLAPAAVALKLCSHSEASFPPGRYCCPLAASSRRPSLSLLWRLLFWCKASLSLAAGLGWVGGWGGS